jgi:hypothetical protein
MRKIDNLFCFFKFADRKLSKLYDCDFYDENTTPYTPAQSHPLKNFAPKAFIPIFPPPK